MNTFNIELYKEYSREYRYNVDQFGDSKQGWANAYALCRRGDYDLVLSRVFNDLDGALDGARILLGEDDWWNRHLSVDFDGDWRYEDFWSNGYDDTDYVIVHYPDDTSPPVRMLLFVKK